MHTTRSIIVNWTDKQQTLFDELRTRKLTGMLTTEEQAQLTKLMALLESEEGGYLAPIAAQIRDEQAALREQLETLQTDNEALARLLNQQQQLVADARHFFVQL